MANNELFYSVARAALGEDTSIAGLVIDLNVAVESYAQYMETVDDNALLERELREAVPHIERFLTDVRAWLTTTPPSEED